MCMYTPGVLHECLGFKLRPLKLCSKCSYPLKYLPRMEWKFLGNDYASSTFLEHFLLCVSICVRMFMCVGHLYGEVKSQSQMLFLESDLPWWFVKFFKLYQFLKHLFVCVCVCMLVQLLWYTCRDQRTVHGNWFFPSNLMCPDQQTCGKHLYL